MNCTKGHRMHCIDSRATGERTRRAYKCKECGERVSTIETKLDKMGASAFWKRKRDTREFTARAMNLKASITALVNEAQKLVG